MFHDLHRIDIYLKRSIGDGFHSERMPYILGNIFGCEQIFMYYTEFDNTCIFSRSKLYLVNNTLIMIVRCGVTWGDIFNKTFSVQSTFLFLMSYYIYLKIKLWSTLRHEQCLPCVGKLDSDLNVIYNIKYKYKIYACLEHFSTVC